MNAFILLWKRTRALLNTPITSYQKGFKRGEITGFDDGFKKGQKEGLAEGEKIGYGKGYEKGYVQGICIANKEVQAVIKEKNTEAAGEYLRGHKDGVNQASIDMGAKVQFDNGYKRGILETMRVIFDDGHVPDPIFKKALEAIQKKRKRQIEGKEPIEERGLRFW